jgi:hypothetical protein
MAAFYIKRVMFDLALRTARFIDISEFSEVLQIFGDMEASRRTAVAIGFCYPTDPSRSFNDVSAIAALARFLR